MYPGELVTRANGDAFDRMGRPSETGQVRGACQKSRFSETLMLRTQIGIVDPECRLIAMHLYDGALKIIPMDAKGALKEAFNVRLEELQARHDIAMRMLASHRKADLSRLLQVIDMKFLHGMPRPTIAILYQVRLWRVNTAFGSALMRHAWFGTQDTKEARHIKTYEVSLRDKDITDGPWQQANLDIGASLIIPIAAPVGGVIVVGEQSVVYLDGETPHILLVFCLAFSFISAALAASQAKCSRQPP